MSPGLALNPVFRLTPAEWEAVLLTLRVGAYAVAGALPVALLAAAIMASRLPGRFLVETFVSLPLALPPVVTGWLLLLLCGIEGPVGAFLWAHFHLRLAFTTAGAALACGAMILPIMARAIRQGMDATDRALLQAARTLGAGPLDRFFSITLPLAFPGLLVAIAGGFTASLGEFGAVITFAANIPGQTQTLPLAIYSALQVPGGEAQATRLAVISIVLATGGLMVAERLFNRLQRRSS